jgi:flagellar motor switch/type III secretory pathway protein FliN
MSAIEGLKTHADVRINVEARLECCSLSVEQLLALQEGSLLRSERAAGDNIDVQIGSQIVGTAEIIVLGTSLGFRIADFREKF